MLITVAMPSASAQILRYPGSTNRTLWAHIAHSVLLCAPTEISEIHEEYTDLKATVRRIIELIVSAGDIEEISNQVHRMSSTVERIISLAHTQSAAERLFKES